MAGTQRDGGSALSPAIQKYAKAEFEKVNKRPQPGGLQEYLEHLDDPASSAPLPIKVDLTHPLSHYFISSSHNTYLSGNQLWSKSSTDSYKDVLKRSCRCIEVDIWDGGSPSSSEAEGDDKDESDVAKLGGLLKRQLNRLRSRSNPDREAQTDSPAGDQTLMPTPWRTDSGRSEPVVYHGYTATKEIPFRAVCATVRDYAFTSSDLPLIVSLEVHCSPPQQEIVVELMKDYWGSFLEHIPKDFSDTTPLPSLEALKKKILVKRLPKLLRDPTTTRIPLAVKKGKIIESLSNMGIFTRAFHFHSFDQPESRIPTHVFSLGESKLLEACEKNPKDLFHHNLHHLMRAYPKGTRVRSSNLDPAPFWRVGVQMVALNFQKPNAAMMLNAAQFDGSGGWMLKPKGYLPVEGAEPVVTRKTLNLKIKLFAAQGLGIVDDTPNCFVKCELHVESEAEVEQGEIPKGGKNKGGERKLRSSVKKSREPDWSGEPLAFDDVREVVPALSFLRVKVMDDVSYQKDRLLGWACYRLDRIPQGLVLIHLRGEDSKGKILMHIETALSDSAVSCKR
ncbi:hypothetical protein AC579_8708 [Pseudocercospora musae]|uniref:Phosphoinositide phospholipase C n=1 Tax=Pseudocercospora musae TaxID=113226 RepID=A0A139IWL8_9PEZI|nr:hypothetical protein AC579_8708 [Pseudocercospora musae]